MKVSGDHHRCEVKDRRRVYVSSVRRSGSKISNVV